MRRIMMKSKIHRATVVGADLNYIGSITLDPALMELADIVEHEQVHVLDIDNGARFETYAIAVAGSNDDLDPALEQAAIESLAQRPSSSRRTRRR